jgi:hypothetical protein
VRLPIEKILKTKSLKGSMAEKRVGRRTSTRSQLHALLPRDDRFVMVAFLSFVVILLFLFDAASDDKQPAQTDYVLKRLVISDASEDSLAFVVQNQVDRQKFMKVASMDYTELKAALNLDADFSVYFEDNFGNVVPIDNVYCLGSPRVRVGGVQCS